MLFKDYHIPMIRSGSKTVTRREWSEDYHPPNEGSVVAATTDLFTRDEDADCYIRIRSIYDQPLGDMSDEDAQSEGDYESMSEFREGYEKVYGDGAWNPDKVVTVVEFDYVGCERPDARPDQTTLITDGGRAESGRATKHPAEKALDEVLDELAGDADVFGSARTGALKMAERWKAFGETDPDFGDGLLYCDVKGCEKPALARVFPTKGETNHEALRCRDCLMSDLNRRHFSEWASAIRRETDV